MDALLVEIMQLCLLLERKGRVAKISWHSGSLGSTSSSILVELWRDRRHYALWMDDADNNIDYFAQYVTYRPGSVSGLQQIIDKLIGELK